MEQERRKEDRRKTDRREMVYYDKIQGLRKVADRRKQDRRKGTEPNEKV